MTTKLTTYGPDWGSIRRHPVDRWGDLARSKAPIRTPRRSRTRRAAVSPRRWIDWDRGKPTGRREEPRLPNWSSQIATFLATTSPTSTSGEAHPAQEPAGFDPRSWSHRRDSGQQAVIQHRQPGAFQLRSERNRPSV